MKTFDITYRYSSDDGSIRPTPPDSKAALLRLEQGNKSFATLLDHDEEAGGVQQIIPVDLRDLGVLADSAVPKQRPFAAVLGCSDARVPVELIFNEGPNDLFVVRVAGNGLGIEVLGSLKYAVENLGGSLKLIVVLGHSGCGALTTAVDVFLNPREYLPLATKRSLRSILDGALVVVQASERKLVAAFGPAVVHRPGYRKALIETSVVTNAALAAYSIQEELRTNAYTGIEAVYGVYLLESRAIWAPRSGDADGMGLAAAPQDLEAFVDLGDAIVQSRRIESLVSAKE
ncbi:carbonic anhydrase [Bradyrhizobium sp. 27S5]|jgi:carbonic anhydrase|uniref:carbonic anhydrase n=1 Tax=Bradyrhizobium sp. 27S5 TaxID=3139728 RepID=UPI0030CC2A21